jgi:phage regulator Rha-like protein
MNTKTIAEHFEVPHDDILQNIRDLRLSKEFCEKNFELCDGYYEITKEGLYVLAVLFWGTTEYQIPVYRVSDILTGSRSTY